MQWLRARGKYVSDDVIELPVLSPELTACCGRGISILECTSEPEETLPFDRCFLEPMQPNTFSCHHLCTTSSLWSELKEEQRAFCLISG
jgi:hypothetical protein